MPFSAFSHRLHLLVALSNVRSHVLFPKRSAPIYIIPCVDQKSRMSRCHPLFQLFKDDMHAGANAHGRILGFRDVMCKANSVRRCTYCCRHAGQACQLLWHMCRSRFDARRSPADLGVPVDHELRRCMGNAPRRNVLFQLHRGPTWQTLRLQTGYADRWCSWMKCRLIFIRHLLHRPARTRLTGGSA